MPNEEMQAAVAEFILQRINACGANESTSLQQAREQFKACAEKLNQTLSTEQNSLYRECENALALTDGETMQCYYRAGFSDAVFFLMSWRDGTWN